MLDPNQNGLIYNGDYKDLYNNVKRLLDNKNERIAISLNAYNTVISEWNANNAVEKLCLVFEYVINNEAIVFNDSGVCSKA